MAQVELILRNLKDPSQKESLVMDLFNNKPIVARWLKQLKKTLSTQPHLDKSFCFLGLPNSHRNVEKICSELEECKGLINDHYYRRFWKSAYKIKENFNRESVIKNGKLNQDLMNRLHHHFEVLSGQTWKTSEYKKKAPHEVKFAIHKLNLLCHEMESYVQQFQNIDQRDLKENVVSSTIVSFMQAEHIELKKEDLEEFEYRQCFGWVSLHYAQIGKRWDEAYFDQDEHVFDSGISGLRYYTGEFNVLWGDFTNKSFQEEEIKIKNWIKSRGVDPDKKEVALGWLYVGEFQREKNFGSKTISEIHDFLARYSDIYEIKVHDGDGVTSARFDYFENDSHYNQMQIEQLKNLW